MQDRTGPSRTPNHSTNSTRTATSYRRCGCGSARGSARPEGASEPARGGTARRRSCPVWPVESSRKKKWCNHPHTHTARKRENKHHTPIHKRTHTYTHKHRHTCTHNDLHNTTTEKGLCREGGRGAKPEGNLLRNAPGQGTQDARWQGRLQRGARCARPFVKPAAQTARCAVESDRGGGASPFLTQHLPHNLNKTNTNRTQPHLTYILKTPTMPHNYPTQNHALSLSHANINYF